MKDDQGLNLVGNKVEYADKKPAFITSYDSNPFPKHPYSATSNYEDMPGAWGKPQLTNVSVKSSEIFTQMQPSERVQTGFTV